MHNPTSQPGFDLIFVLVFIAFTMAALFAARRRIASATADPAEARRKINELYRQTVLRAEDPRYALDGSTASIVRDEEAPESDSGGEYAITRYARNPDGEYFMLMFEVKQGTARLVFSKPMEQHIARYVLGGQYIQPPQV